MLIDNASLQSNDNEMHFYLKKYIEFMINIK